MSTDLAVPEQLLDVRTGELVAATAVNAAELWLAADDYERRMRRVRSDCATVLLEESRQTGKRTMRFGAVTATVTGGEGKGLEWDTDVLLGLRDLGLPEERYDELVVATVTYKVNANVARQIAGANPEYANVIERARSRPDTTPRVYVK